MSKHDLEQKKALIELMNNEPLMSAELYYDNNNNDKLNTSELMKAYATYHTNWYKENEKLYSDKDMDEAYGKGFKDAMYKYRE